MKPSEQLATLLDHLMRYDAQDIPWRSINGYSHSDPPRLELSYDWQGLTKEQIRKLKLAFPKFETKGGEAYRWLQACLELDGLTILCLFEGAFRCEISSSQEYDHDLTETDRKAREAQIAKLQNELSNGRVTRVEHKYDCSLTEPKAE